jgi:hypothetical protein
MTWVEWLLLGPACCYMAAALYYVRHGQAAFGVVYGCYAVANIGLIVAAIQGR